MTRFAVREAVPADAAGIARVHVESWQTSYRGILPDRILDRLDVGQRVESRRRMLASGDGLHLVAYDVTHGDIVGYCDAGAARRNVGCAGEVYAIYLAHHAKRHGLGQEMWGRVKAWLAAREMTSMVVWVLENNHHARRFYEAMGGTPGVRVHSTVAGFPIVELSYVWERF